MPSTLAPARPRATRPGARAAWFRPDIEGLRAVALLAVLAFHASVPGLAGGYVGVDVFFTISGFLITTLLLHEARDTGRIRLAAFFARRARRLLPSAAVVLIVSAPAAYLLLPPLSRPDFYRELLYAALCSVNWWFIGERTDYLAAGRDESPLLHFWSLAVEEQFYLAWAPLFALVVLACAARSRRLTRAALIAATVAVTAGSLWLCLRWSGEAVSYAYLGTPSRAWQFGAGALVALLPWRALRVPGTLRTAAGWAGAAAIGWSAVWFDAATVYPGTASLIPTLGTAAVIAAATGREDDPHGGPRFGIGRLLATRLPRAVGRLSYQWYLWHWPVLVLVQAATGPVGPAAACLLTLAALLPALATRRWVERPLRSNRAVTELPRRGLSLGVSAVLIPVLLALVAGSGAVRALGPVVPVDTARLPAGATTGASLLAPGVPAPDALLPSSVQARADFPPAPGCEVPPSATTSPPCRFGEGTRRIVLLGDSHAGQWFSAVNTLAERRGWAVEVLVKQGCPLARITVVNPQLGRAYTECDTWRDHALERIGEGPRPELIVIASLNHYTADQRALRRGWDDTLRRLRATGAPVAYLKDTPAPGLDVPACVSGSPDDPGRCAFDRHPALAADPLAEDIEAGRRPGLHLLDANEALCPGSGPRCPAVRQRVLLYRDSAHLTNTAALLLAPRLEHQLTAAGLLPAADGWTTVFHDDFDGARGSAPAASRWQHDTGTCYPGCPAPQWGTGEIETMTDSTGNVRLDGAGVLEIRPTRGPDGGWLSGRIATRTSGIAAPPGGVLRIEASIALPDVTGRQAAGYWPAFWALGARTRPSYTGWPATGEIDVMENVNGAASVFGTLHCGRTPGGPCAEPEGRTSGEQSLPGGGFHTYAVEIDRSTTPEEIRWYVDGRRYHRVTAADTGDAAWKEAVHPGFFLILNVAVGGALPEAAGGRPGPWTSPGHPMRVEHVTAKTRKAP